MVNCFLLSDMNLKLRNYRIHGAKKNVENNSNIHTITVCRPVLSAEQGTVVIDTKPVLIPFV